MIRIQFENLSQRKLNASIFYRLSKSYYKSMELIGLEPTTSSLQSWRSPS